MYQSVILAPGHTRGLNLKHSKIVFSKIQNFWKKYLHIENNVHFQVYKVQIQNTMYSTLLKKDKIIDLDV
jgi:hypothetical protein